MTLAQLQYVEVVSRLRSFSKASKELHITQPALTLQIKKLEEELGFSIFNRTKMPLVITKEGEVFLKRAIQIIRLVDDLYDVAIELEEEISGTLNIGAIPTIAPYLTPVFMENLHKEYPKLRLSIKEQLTEEIITSVKNGEIDAGIIATPVQAKGVEFRTLFYEKFFLYVSDRSPFYKRESINLNEIDLSELWYLNEGNCFQNQVNAICEISNRISEKQNFRYQSNSIESLRYIVEYRGGMTFIPELATLTVSSEKEEMVKTLNGIQPVREISMVTAKFVSKQKLLDAFLEILMSNIPKGMKSVNKNMIVNTDIIADY